MKRKWTLGISLAVIVALIVAPLAFADNLLGDGDGMEPVTRHPLDFGTVCAGSTVTDSALIAVRRVASTNPTQVFGDGSTVLIEVEGPFVMTGTGTLSAVIVGDPNITLPSNWVSLSTGSLSDPVSTTVTFVAGSPGPFAGAVIYRGTGQDVNGAETIRKGGLQINADIVDCPTRAHLNVVKFYDANGNGVNDDGLPITGWKVTIDPGSLVGSTPVSQELDPGDYTVTEASPVEANWLSTTSNPVSVSLAAGDDKTVEFGNVCLGAGGGLTLGFWSNKNGQAAMNDGGTLAPELALLSSLNLRNANGTNFDPANYNSFRTWLLNATATNMAYMLSAQLAAMELNVEAGFVNGNTLIYAPGTNSANALGFASVNAVMSEANTELGAHGLTLDGSPDRAYQEALKNALDRANNNLNFVQATPCAFSFAP